MTLEFRQKESRLGVKVRGRLDALTTPDLEAKLDPLLPEILELDFDFERLLYISSAGLRLLLKLQKHMNHKGGKMLIRNINDIVGDVLEVTGFVDFLTIEPAPGKRH